MLGDLEADVLGELMRAEPAQAVLDWFAQHDATDLYISSVTEAELRAGAAYLPKGQRRDRLQQAIDAMIEQDFNGRILPFDTIATRPYAQIAVARRASGRPIAEADCQIAAIAASIGAPMATRNVRDFDGCGVAVINPWNAA